jgi:hypothetical protein
MKKGLLLFVSATAMAISAQLPNDVLNLAPPAPRKPIGLSFEAFPFLKNNEYFNTINPGETYFGFRTQAAAVFNLQPGGKAQLSTGIMIQENYGGKTTVKPVFQLSLKSYSEWNYIFGALKSGTRHGLIEPLYNYEQTLFQPIEYGIQVRKNNNRVFYDGWLEWRQQLNPVSNRQEMLIAGQHFDYKLINGKRGFVSFPMQAILVHQGGQALNPPVNISTRINAAAGIRLGKRDTSLLAEFYALQSLDNSPNPSQPWKNGWATMTNLRIRFKRFHTLAATWWFAREFSTTTGSPVFSNVNLNNVYANSHSRSLAMLRYVYSRPILGSKIWIDARIEPHYDFQRGRTEFSHGLYVKYITTGEIKIPRIPGLF